MQRQGAGQQIHTACIVKALVRAGIEEVPEAGSRLADGQADTVLWVILQASSSSSSSNQALLHKSLGSALWLLQIL